MSSAKTKKFLQAIKDGKITDDKSALLWILKERGKENLISEIIPQVKGKQGEIGKTGGIGPRGETGKSVKGRDGIDGKDADIEQIVVKAVQKILQEIKPIIPDIRDIEADLPLLKKEIRKALELLEDNDKLSISAIKGLEDYDEIKKLAKQPRIGGGSIARNFYQLFDVPENYANQSGKMLSVKSDETGLEFTTAVAVASETTDLSSQLDGSTTEFDLGQTVINVIVVNLNGTLIDFTLNSAKTKITIEFSPESGESLKAIVLI